MDGEEQTKDVIVLPERVLTNWWRAEGHGLVLADLEEVLEELPAHLIVGTGAYGQLRPDPKTLDELRARRRGRGAADGRSGAALLRTRCESDGRGAPSHLLTRVQQTHVQ